MLREIAAKLGVEVDDKAVEGLMKNLDGAKGALAGLGKALLSGAFAMFIKDQIDGADALGDTAERLGVSTDALQEFQYALKLTGGEAEGAEKAIFLLNKAIGNASEKGGGEFAALGIDIKDAEGNARDALSVLPDLADKIAQAGSESERTAIATKFFGKQSLALLPLLKRGREGIEELNAEFRDLGGGISKETIEGASKVADELDRLGFVSKAAGGQLLGALMPALQTGARWFIKLAAYVTHLAKTTTVLRTASMLLGVGLAAKLLPSVMTAIRAFTALRTVVFGASIPLWLVVAVIGALYLIFDDLYALMTGGNSVIGTLLDKFGAVGDKQKLIDNMRQAWSTLKQVWSDIRPIIEDLWKKLGVGASDIAPALAKAFAAVVKGIVAGITAFATLISAADKAAHGQWKAAGDEIIKGSDAIFGKRRNIKEIDGQGNVTEVEANVGGLFGKTEEEWNKIANPHAAAPTNVETKVENKINVTVNAANMTPEQAAKATQTGVGTATSDALGALTNAIPKGALGTGVGGL